MRVYQGRIRLGLEKVYGQSIALVTTKWTSGLLFRVFLMVHDPLSDLEAGIINPVRGNSARLCMTSQMRRRLLAWTTWRRNQLQNLLRVLRRLRDTGVPARGHGDTFRDFSISLFHALRFLPSAVHIIFAPYHDASLP